MRIVRVLVLLTKMLQPYTPYRTVVTYYAMLTGGYCKLTVSLLLYPHRGTRSVL